MRYLPHTVEDVRAMLEASGKSSIEELFSSIPNELLAKVGLDLQGPLDEARLIEHVRSLGAKTTGRPFLGAGCYPHHVPSLIGQMLQRGELLTAYTPYQPECSQGTLQLIFEFQTMVTALTGLDVANASMYDGAHATAEAAQMALRARRKTRRVLVSSALHPEYRDVLSTYLAHGAASMEEVPFDGSGAIDLQALKQALGDDVACVIAGYPNFFGIIEPLDEISALAGDHKALTISVTMEPVALGLLAPPGSLGADVATGEMGSFGNPMSFGGPSVGFFAAREQYTRQLPGRLVGATVDEENRRGFVLTLSTREQHIRREKATSNICTNQGLCAAAATMHLSLLGRSGVRELARINWLRARYLRQLLAERGLRSAFDGSVFNEFALSVEDPKDAIARIEDAGLEGGLDLSAFYQEEPAKSALLLCVTEAHSPDEIEKLADALGGKR